MTTKSVLLTTYPEAYLHKGGGEYELLEVALNLKKLGVVADVYGPYSRDVERYDVVLHFSVSSSGFPLLEAARACGKKIILWPNFWTPKNHDSDLPATIQRFFEMTDIAVFKSRTELDNLKAIVPLAEEKVLIIPTGVDPCFAEPTPERLFRDSFGVEEYIVWTGIIEPRKNQLEIINTLSDLEIPLVLIGNYRDAAYYGACRAAAPKHFLFLGPMEHKSDIMRAAIRESRLYIEPGLEPAGKSVLEAAICGARILVSDQPWEREHLGHFAVYVDPKCEESIRKGITYALATPVEQSQVCTLAKKHLMPRVLDKLVTYITETS